MSIIFGVAFGSSGGGGGGSGDTTDPVVTVTAPASSTAALVIQAYDDTGVSHYQFSYQDSADGQRLIMYESGTGFIHPFNSGSTISGAGTSADPYILTIYKRGRWPTGVTIYINGVAIDAAGNSVSL